MSCEHNQFQAQVNVGRLLDEKTGKVNAFIADVTVHCAECNEPFVFIAPVVGLTWDGPAVSPNGQELRAPIRPRSSFGESIALPGFTITRRAK